MNYYKFGIKSTGFEGNAWIDHLSCCALTEANIADTTGEPHARIGDLITLAMAHNKSFLIWAIPMTNYHRDDMRIIYDEVDEILEALPATTFVGQERNTLTGHQIRVYVTNLKQEW